MPRKPNSRSSRSAKDDAVSLEQQKLAEMQNDILRKQRELERVLKEAPAKIQKQRKRTREYVKLHVNAPAAAAVPPGGLRDRFSSDVDTGARRRKPRRSERTVARVQFLVLCLILFTIVLLIWQSIPS